MQSSASSLYRSSQPLTQASGSTAASSPSKSRLGEHPSPKPWWKRPLQNNAAHASQPHAESPTRALTGPFASLVRFTVDLASAAPRAFTASLQLAFQSREALDRLRRHAVNMKELRSFATETGNAINTSVTHIGQAEQVIGEVAALAGNRSRLVQQLIAVVERSESNFAELNRRFDEVEHFVATIQQIGNQSSLLALNGAIEASRAGAHGAGFNVVARETRSLADRTAAATKQILSITEGMREWSAVTSASMLEATAWREDNKTIGQSAVKRMQSCQALLTQARDAAARAASGVETQTALVDQCCQDWEIMRENARQCSFEADDSAECSADITDLATHLVEELQKLGAKLPAHSPPEQLAMASHHATLEEIGAECRAKTGLDELNRLKPHIRHSLNNLLEECMAHGPASRHTPDNPTSPVPELRFGDLNMETTSTWIDSHTRSTGLLNSLFVLSTEPEPSFYRVATSLRRSDGQRALGTQLNPRGNSARKLLRGESTYGYVFVLGLPFLCAYRPILDATGTVIGAVCTGTAIKDENHPLLRANPTPLEEAFS